MEEPKKIGIVTVLYNSESVLEDFFNTLNEQTYKNFVLYVIDNKSTDNSLAAARSLSEEVFFKTVFFAEPKNWGVAKGNNIGIIRALADGCDYVLLSNNDIVLEPNTIQGLVADSIENNTDISVPKILYYGSDLIWQAGGRFVYCKGSTCHIGNRKKDEGQFDTPARVSYASTCFMLIKRNVFGDIGFMDEHYFVYYDDTDFMWRAVNRRKKIMYLPDSRIWHKESVSTGGQMSDFTLYYMARNEVYFALKNFGFVHRGIVILYNMLHDLFRKPFSLTTEQRKKVWNGRRDGRKLFKSVL